MSHVAGGGVAQSSPMGTWTAQTTVAGDPDEVLSALTEPDLIARWSPIEFELVDRRHDPLRAGDRVRVRGFLAGRCLEFRVHVTHAGGGCLRLHARGPIELEVEYVAIERDAGSSVHAWVQVTGRGLVGRVLAQATDALLAAGALQSAVSRIARELCPRPAVEPRTSARELEPALA